MRPTVHQMPPQRKGASPEVISAYGVRSLGPAARRVLERRGRIFAEWLDSELSIAEIADANHVRRPVLERIIRVAVAEALDTRRVA